MADNILFQRDRLTVAESHLRVGHATVFYANISAVSIYDGHPLRPAAIMGAFGLIPVSLFLFWTARLFAGMFSVTPFLMVLIPWAGASFWAFQYQIKCLFDTIDGQAVAVLKSKEIADLEQAKTMIEQAKAVAGR